MARRLLIFLLLIGAGAVAACEPAGLPDTPAGHALRGWLEAFNDADRGKLEAYGKTWGELQTVEDTLGFRDFTGGYALEAVESSEPRKLVALVSERDGQMARTRLTLRLDEADQPKLLAMDIDPLPIERVDQAAALAGLSARAKALADEDDYSGAFLVARHGEILMQQAHGMEDRGAGTPATLETRFRYGSAGKMFTAVAVLQLVESGRLSLDGKVGDYLPDYPNRDLARKVTLRHLLTHTGGTGGLDSLETGYAGDRSKLRTLSDYVAMHGARATAFEPGSKVEYSNYGYVLLGAIIEEVTGDDYYTVIGERVLGPAGMTATGYAPETEPVPGRAVAYRRQGDAWVDAKNTLPWRGTPAGGGYTTVGDLLKFAQALQSGKLLSKAMMEKATSPQMDENWYGFGFITVGEGGLRRYGHGGDADGMNADFRVFPESGWVLISLSNFDPPAAYRLTRWFEPRMPVAAPKSH